MLKHVKQATVEESFTKRIDARNLRVTGAEMSSSILFSK